MLKKKKAPPPEVKAWLTEEEYAKAVGQLRLSIGAILGSTFSLYGMGAYTPGATEAIVKLAEDFSLRCRGLDKPIMVDYRSPLD